MANRANVGRVESKTQLLSYLSCLFFQIVTFYGTFGIKTCFSFYEKVPQKAKSGKKYHYIKIFFIIFATINLVIKYAAAVVDIDFFQSTAGYTFHHAPF